MAAILGFIVFARYVIAHSYRRWFANTIGSILMLHFDTAINSGLGCTGTST